MTTHPHLWQDPALVAASLVGIPTPRPLSEMSPEILQSNTDIARSESVYYPLTDAEMAEGHLTEERR